MTTRANENGIPEPIIIYYGENKWVHPEIESMVEWGVGMKGESIDSDIAVRDIVKVYLHDIDHPGQILGMIVVLCNKMKTMNMPFYEMEANFDVLFREDVWITGDEQFIFTEFGESFGNLYDKSELSCYYPDAAVERKGDDYEYYG